MAQRGQPVPERNVKHGRREHRGKGRRGQKCSRGRPEATAWVWQEVACSDAAKEEELGFPPGLCPPSICTITPAHDGSPYRVMDQRPCVQDKQLPSASRPNTRYQQPLERPERKGQEHRPKQQVASQDFDWGSNHQGDKGKWTLHDSTSCPPVTTRESQASAVPLRAEDSGRWDQVAVDDNLEARFQCSQNSSITQQASWNSHQNSDAGWEQQDEPTSWRPGMSSQWGADSQEVWCPETDAAWGEEPTWRTRERKATGSKPGRQQASWSGSQTGESCRQRGWIDEHDMDVEMPVLPAAPRTVKEIAVQKSRDWRRSKRSEAQRRQQPVLEAAPLTSRRWEGEHARPLREAIAEMPWVKKDASSVLELPSPEMPSPGWQEVEQWGNEWVLPTDKKAEESCVHNIFADKGFWSDDDIVMGLFL